MAGPPTILVHLRRTSTHGQHALLGALETMALPAEVEVRFARGAELAAALAALDPPALVVWSFYSPEAEAVASELAGVGRRPGVLHVAGGVHATAEPDATLAMGFDLVAVGEGETTFCRLLEQLCDGGDPAAVPGLVLPGGGRTGPAVRAPLDRFPSFAARWGRFNPIEITRGCVYSCSFCQTPSMFKARFRHRSVGDVCRHVEVQLAHGRRDVRFLTPTSLSYGAEGTEPDLGAVEELLSAVRATLDRGGGGRLFFGSFPSEVRPEHVTPEALALVRRYADNDNLIVGAQSGSQAVLDATNRGHGVDAVRRAVRHCVDAGLTPNVDFLFGLPGEGGDEAAASLALAEELSAMGARIHGHTFMPLPGTALRSAPPGRVDPALLARLQSLEGRGSLYGQWRAQQETAVRLAATRRRPPPDGR